MKDRIFFDTNIICYSFDINEPTKRKICREFMIKVLRGEIIGVVSNQVLGEIFNATINKFKVKPVEAKTIVQGIIQSSKWQKVNYTQETVNSATESFEYSGIPFWDLVIIETLRENNISKIITENERDFVKADGIKVINPF